MELRQRREFEDLQIWEDRKREEMQINLEQQKADLEEALREKLNSVEDAYDLERQLLGEKYDNDLTDLAVKFATEENLTGLQLQHLAELYDAFYGTDGAITNILNGFYRQKAELGGVDIGAIERYEDAEADYLAMLGLGPGSQAFSSENTQYVEVNITSDGTIPETFLDAVRDDVTQVITSILDRRY